MSAAPAVPTRAALARTTFSTSRLLEFCSRKELVAQTGHPVEEWPQVVLKELIDNALDNCEESGVAPFVAIEVRDGNDAAAIRITDNGSGIPATTVKRLLDFSVRVSSREAYVAPDRGAQGNALKTLIAMPYVLDGKAGRVTIEARGVAHRILFRTDPIRQKPVIEHDTVPSDVKTGTRVTLHWPALARSNLIASRSRFLQIADDCTWLNPHLAIRLTWNGEHQPVNLVGNAQANWQKWKPSEPTSPHWYKPERFERLIGAYIGHDRDRKRDRLVREFVSEFRGLSGSAKQAAVLDATGMARAPLSSLCHKDGFERRKVTTLLDAMKAASKPVRPALLGIIGKDHLARQFKAAGAHPDTFNYRRTLGVTDDLPWVAEVAFGFCPEAKSRRFVVGVNWSPGISNPFREIGRYGEGLETLLSQQRATREEPVIIFVHLAIPRPEYRDRGKSAIVVPGMAPERDHDNDEDDEDEAAAE